LQITGSDSSEDTTLITRRKLKPAVPRGKKRQRSVSTNPQTMDPQWVTGRWAKCKPYQNRKCGPGWKRRKVSCKIGKERSNRWVPLCDIVVLIERVQDAAKSLS